MIATTKSGLTIHTIELEHNGVHQTLVQEHSWLVRFTHWVNAISLVVLTMSGLQIYTAFPSFGAKIPQKDLWHVPEWMRLGDWLGEVLE
jgi:Ni,Fe-hydrogenase I cytochrome b subunit